MGRPKGAKNKRTMLVEEIAMQFDKDPFEILMMVAMGDWEGLGFAEKTKITYTAQGIEVEEDNVKLSERVSAAKEASKYLHSAKQSVALSTGDSGIKIIIEDFSKSK